MSDLPMCIKRRTSCLNYRGITLTSRYTIKVNNKGKALRSNRGNIARTATGFIIGRNRNDLIFAIKQIGETQIEKVKNT